MKQENKKLNPYQMGWIDKIPYNIKVLIIKFWFAGAVYYFAGWGIYSEQLDAIDYIVILGLILGIIYDLFVSNILRFMETDKIKADKYLFFRKKRFYSIFINVIYCIFLSSLIAYTYHLLSIGNLLLGAEPFSYGLFFVMYDYVILLIINYVRKLLSDIKSKRRSV